MSVNLILKTTDISLSSNTTDYYNNTVTTTAGYVTNSRTSFSWKNINMKLLLGDLYEKYEKFQIALVYSSGSATGTTAETISNKRMLQVKLSGLPFLSSYNQAKGLNTIIAMVSSIKIPTDASATWSSNNNIAQYFVFTKQTMMDFNIDLHTIVDDTNPLITTINQMIGHCLFSFTIIPVDEMKNEKLDIKTYGYNKNF
jgi:hypothetical protein